ncbi:Ubiquitin [Gossypium australe]|uniref:Ubiquitin n=1 Tax=Gossypium australe TaxID=47621 RepID=A0A5B6VGZ3_9ROSI|nr:Ubiquitin [Gossypium australe]
MYIRVKRSKTTYFIQCDPTETTLDIKQKLHTLIDQPANDQRLILMNTGDILEDSKTLADQKVENDAVVALTLRKAFISLNCFLLHIIHFLYKVKVVGFFKYKLKMKGSFGYKPAFNTPPFKILNSLPYFVYLSASPHKIFEPCV